MRSETGLTSRSSSKLYRALAGVGILCMVAVPVALAGFIYFKATNTKLETPTQVWFPLKKSESQIESQVGLKLNWKPTPPLVAPAWNGIVQLSYLTPGDAITTGTKVARIDGVDRIAAATSEPFFRALSKNDSGPDVSSLNALLADLGYDSAEGDTFSEFTSTGVKQLATELGIANSDGTFNPSWIVFVPKAFKVESIKFKISSPAPAAGEEIVTGLPSLSSAKFISPTDVSVLLDADPEKTKPRVSEVAIPENTSLSIGEAKINTSKDLKSVSEKSLPEVEKQVAKGASAVVATAIQATDKPVWVVPSSAMYIDSSAKSCVLAQQAGQIKAIQVSQVSARETDILVSGPLEEVRTVALNPGLDPRSC